MRHTESINLACDRIAQRESEIHALVEDTLDFDRIHGDAAELLRRHPDASRRPPLFGMLLGVKDIFNVDGYLTRCGSRLPAEELTGPEAPVVTRLKRAGMVIAAKTVTAEFAGSDPGPTRNPLNLEHTPGGSSSGSAAGVAAGFFDLALGSQTGGSVIRPAAYCGVVGYKPSFGRVGTEGMFTYSESMDHFGLLARDIELIEKAMMLLVDDWRGEAVCAEPRFVLPEGPYLDIAAESARRSFNEIVEYLRQYGLQIGAHGVLEDIDQQNANRDRLVNAEAYRVHAGWFERYRDLYGPLLRAALEEGRDTPDDELDALRATARHKQLDMQRCMRDLEIDYWLAPAALDVAPQGLDSTGDHRMNSIWTYTGLPVISLPSGNNHAGLPYGLQIVGRYNHDEELLATARSLQRMLPVRNDSAPAA